MRNFEDLKIAVAGTGYVGLSMATLLSQNHQVTAVDVIPEKVEKINNRVSPIQDEYIEKYFAEKDLKLSATLDGATAYKDADFVIYVKYVKYVKYVRYIPYMRPMFSMTQASISLADFIRQDAI